jgi:hypothetical protein
MILAATMASALLGDSIAAGLAPWINPAEYRTINGATTAYAWERASVSGLPIVLVIGTNDTPSSALAERMMALARAMPGATLIGPPCSTYRQQDARIEAVEAIQAAAWPAARYLRLGHLRSPLSATCRPENRTADGIHFSSAGYRALAYWIIASIRPK